MMLVRESVCLIFSPQCAAMSSVDRFNVPTLEINSQLSAYLDHCNLALMAQLLLPASMGVVVHWHALLGYSFHFGMVFYLYPRSFIVTPSDGSITNIWLVQNGTKCGTNQVRIQEFVLFNNENSLL